MKALSSGGAGDPGNSLVACRTRSKRPLRDVPLDQLEAELRAPDITPDMYDNVSTPKDREWTQWLQGLMTSHLDNEGQQAFFMIIFNFSHLSFILFLLISLFLFMK